MGVSEARRRVQRDDLLEREGELVELEAQLGAAAGGRGAVVVVRGPAGVGKTRLLEVAKDRAGATGLEPLSARGTPLEEGFAFGVARQLLEPAIRALDPDAVATALSGAAALAAPVLGLEVSSPGLSAADPTHAAIHGLYWLPVNLAERRPLLLAVDDARWADGASSRWLAYLAARLEAVAVALVVSIREGDPGAEADALGELRRARHGDSCAGPVQRGGHGHRC